MTIHELCKELNNWFDRGQPKWIGRVEINENSISYKGLQVGYSQGLVELQEGQYFRIVGSVFNDGVYQYPTNSLHNETFDGAIWAMAIPQEVIALSKEIDEWVEKYGKADSAAMSPFQSESFGGYSYSKGSRARSSDGNGTSDPNTWQSAFSDRLKLWRKA
ncbi:MAG: hypothetical protein IJP92_00810 [Lachnospiraceae bacterium]|nr:hypothetical protein [Lachnospiraceae bacterium]